MPEQQFSTSFIPKKAPESGTKRASGQSVLTLIAGIIFVVILFSVGGVFLYERLLAGAIEDKRATLERAEDAFEPALIEELLALDTRLSHAIGLLDRHRMPSAIFEILEETTLENVRFRNFSYSTRGGEILISLDGEATSFATVALQSDVYGNSSVIRDPLIDDLAVNAEGNVTFALEMLLDPSALTYVARGSRVDEVPEAGTLLPPPDSGTDTESLDEQGTPPTGSSGDGSDGAEEFEGESLEGLPEL